jgi:hypothetical protein
MNDEAPPILSYLRQQAVDRNIPEDEIPELWAQHCERAKTDCVDPGGKRWVAFLDAVVRGGKSDARALSRMEAELLERRSRAKREERQRKAAAEAEYASQAVSLDTWVGMLREQALDPLGEPLSPHEMVIVQATSRPARVEALGIWLWSVLAEAPPRPRGSYCPSTVEATGQVCGLPVARWVHDGRAFHAGRCEEHHR